MTTQTLVFPKFSYLLIHLHMMPKPFRKYTYNETCTQGTFFLVMTITQIRLDE